MTLGEKIHQLRKARGTSQEELAGRLAVSRQAVSKWELGEAKPDTENIVQLSKMFGVSTDYLLTDEYESDKDIPAVKINGENLAKESKRKPLRTASYWLIGVGLLGVLTLWILSSAIIAYKTVPDPNISQALYNEETGEWIEMVPPEGTFFTTIRVRGDLGAFLQTYNFTALFVLCWISALAGVTMLLCTFGEPKREEKEDK